MEKQIKIIKMTNDLIKAYIEILIDIKSDIQDGYKSIACMRLDVIIKSLLRGLENE